MDRETKRIGVAPDSEVATILKEAAETRTTVEVNGTTYEVRILRRSQSEQADLLAGYDPDKVRRAVAETAGSWSDLDVDAMIADLYRARDQGSRSADRP